MLVHALFPFSHQQLPMADNGLRLLVLNLLTVGAWCYALSTLSIPVILADGIVEPFELFLDYRLFTDTPHLLSPHRQRILGRPLY
jgi:hypothetical protein